MNIPFSSTLYFLNREVLPISFLYLQQCHIDKMCEWQPTQMVVFFRNCCVFLSKNLSEMFFSESLKQNCFSTQSWKTFRLKSPAMSKVGHTLVGSKNSRSFTFVKLCQLLVCAVYISVHLGAVNMPAHIRP